MDNIKYILFDAANTLIHKPSLWDGFLKTFNRYNINVDIYLLKKNHKILSELIAFPDKTSSDFYEYFNSELLYSLGILPNKELLRDIFNSCTYLAWEPFEDTNILKEIRIPLGILSNFNSSLPDKINKVFPNIFSDFFVSEDMNVSKPNLLFYENAVKQLNLNPAQILYVGDSIKLDIEPANKIGMMAFLIDRNNHFPAYRKRLNSLNELLNLILENHG